MYVGHTGAPLGCCAVQERVGELLAEEEEEGQVAAAAAAAGAGGQMERPRPLTSRELEDVVVRSCLVPVEGVPSAVQVIICCADVYGTGYFVCVVTTVKVCLVVRTYIR